MKESAAASQFTFAVRLVRTLRHPTRQTRAPRKYSAAAVCVEQRVPPFRALTIRLRSPRSSACHLSNTAHSMNTVVKQIKRCFTIYSALFITLITTRIRGLQHCGHGQLSQCSKPLSVLTDSGLTFVSNKTDLERICPDLKEALRCIHKYTRECMNLQHRKHFKQLFHGTGAMVHELCNNSTYQEEFLQYAPCMKKTAQENEVCFSRYSRAMNDIQSKDPAQEGTEQGVISRKRRGPEEADEGIKNVCCNFQEYVQCSTHSMRRACGDEAAHFSRKFLDRMSSNMIMMHCSEYGPEQCGLTGAAAPSWRISATLQAFGTSLLLLLLRHSLS